MSKLLKDFWWEGQDFHSIDENDKHEILKISTLTASPGSNKIAVLCSWCGSKRIPVGKDYMSSIFKMQPV